MLHVKPRCLTAFLIVVDDELLKNRDASSPVTVQVMQGWLRAVFVELNCSPVKQTGRELEGGNVGRVSANIYCTFTVAQTDSVTPVVMIV